jgi:hypothetical protein
MDLVFVAMAIAFFAASGLLVFAFERLHKH